MYQSEFSLNGIGYCYIEVLGFLFNQAIIESLESQCNSYGYYMKAEILTA